MSSRSALVIDDSKSARYALRKYLEGHAYRVDTAESAEEAMRLLGQHQPEVIFLDHVMPGTDGFEALRAIKADPLTGGIPVVICSSNEGEEFNAQARSRGAADVLQKPPSPDQLSRILAGLEQLTSAFRPATASVVAVPAGAGKVANLREPDVAIEQAVMKALRSALPPPVAPVSAPSIAPTLSAAPREDQLQQFEQRLRRITQDLYAQLGEVRAGVAHLDVGLNRPDDQEARTQALLQSALAGTQQTLQALEARIEGVEEYLQAQLGELRVQIDAALQDQAERIGRVVESARAAAAEEAHAAAERTVMAAASRIADRLAQSILSALGRAP